jgi:hypothetical protein
LDLLKKDASRKLQKQSEESLEFDIDDIYKPDSPLDIPQRPAWNYRMSKNDIDQRENAYFKNYLDKIFLSFDSKLLSYFELNLETWRQLWRVLEISDIILFIVDARFPVGGQISRRSTIITKTFFAVDSSFFADILRSRHK